MDEVVLAGVRNILHDLVDILGQIVGVVWVQDCRHLRPRRHLLLEFFLLKMKFDVLISRLHRQRAEVDFTAQAPIPRRLSFTIFDDARLLTLLSRGALCSTRSLGGLWGSASGNSQGDS